MQKLLLCLFFIIPLFGLAQYDNYRINDYWHYTPDIGPVYNQSVEMKVRDECLPYEADHAGYQNLESAANKDSFEVNAFFLSNPTPNLLEKIAKFPAVCRLELIYDADRHVSINDIFPALQKFPKLRFLRITVVPEKVPGTEVYNTREWSFRPKDAIDIAPSLGKLTSLRALILSGNIKSIPEDIGKLNRLMILRINSSNLTALPSSVSQLKDLVSLSITGWDEQEMRTDYNENIQYGENKEMCQIKNLTAGILELTQLEQLDIWSTELDTLPSLERLNNLRSLTLACPKLKSLRINSGEKTNNDFLNLYSCSSLQKITLSNPDAYFNVNFYGSTADNIFHVLAPISQKISNLYLNAGLLTGESNITSLKKYRVITIVPDQYFSQDLVRKLLKKISNKVRILTDYTQHCDASLEEISISKYPSGKVISRKADEPYALPPCNNAITLHEAIKQGPQYVLNLAICDTERMSLFVKYGKRFKDIQVLALQIPEGAVSKSVFRVINSYRNLRSLYIVLPNAACFEMLNPDSLPLLAEMTVHVNSGGTLKVSPGKIWRSLEHVSFGVLNKPLEISDALRIMKYAEWIDIFNTQYVNAAIYKTLSLPYLRELSISGFNNVFSSNCRPLIEAAQKIQLFNDGNKLENAFGADKIELLTDNYNNAECLLKSLYSLEDIQICDIQSKDSTLFINNKKTLKQITISACTLRKIPSTAATLKHLERVWIVDTVQSHKYKLESIGGLKKLKYGFQLFIYNPSDKLLSELHELNSDVYLGLPADFLFLHLDELDAIAHLKALRILNCYDVGCLDKCRQIKKKLPDTDIFSVWGEGFYGY